MKRAILLSLVLAFSFLSPAADTGPSIIVATINPQGEIKFEVVDDFLIGGNREIRLLPEPKGDVDPTQIKKLPKTKLNVAGILRGDGTGRLVRLNDNGTREVVLPEDFSPKVAVKPADLKGLVMLTLIPSKKTKQTVPLPADQFYALLMGTPPDHVALEFVSNSKAFGGGLDEQLRAMAGFVKSFPDSAAVGEFRNLRENQMEVELADLENGGKFDQLLAVQRFGKLARDAYPNDATLKNLYERIVERRTFIEDKLAFFQSLALAGEWDVLLRNYSDFERYQKSFPTIVALKQQAYEESARSHSRRARAYSTREDHDTAATEAATAQQRDPSNPEIVKLVDAEKLVSSQVAAGNAAAKRKVLAKNSPEENRFDTAKFNAASAIKDQNYARAENEINNMERENPDAPEIYLMRADLLDAQGNLASALPRLDTYDRMVSDSAERDKSRELRRKINYDLEKKKDDNRKEIARLMKARDYTQLNALMTPALTADPNDLDYLYYGGLAAAVLRNNDLANKYLKAYLDRSDSKDGDPDLRERAGRILNAVGGTKAAAAADGTPNWLSGRRLADGIYYDPETLAFQIRIDSILGIGGNVKKTFTWNQNRLDSIETSFEKDGKQNYLKWLGVGPLDPTALGATDEPGNFYFRYLPAGGPLLTVRTNGSKAAAIPGLPAAAPTAAGARPKDFRVVVNATPGKPTFLADDDGQPEIVFPSHPQVNIAVLNILDGPVATIVSGNAMFNPFLWDGLHYFSVQYDVSGRAEVAQEWNADNRVTFGWDGQRLKEVRAFHRDSPMPYYRRTIAYAPTGTNIVSEEVTLNGHSGEAKYVYNNTGSKTLQLIKVDSDGKDWVVKPR